MKKRVNNDLKQTLTILRDGVAEIFTTATNIELKAYIPNLYSTDIPFTRVNNVFSVAAPANTLKIGVYTYVLTYNKPDTDFESGLATYTIDFKDAFEIVRHTEDEDAEGQNLSGNVGDAVLPSGGNLGDMLVKKSNASNDFEWLPVLKTTGTNDIRPVSQKLVTDQLALKVDKVEGKELSSNDYDDAAVLEVAKIADKVDKITGKGLSTNDYTNEAVLEVAKIVGKKNYHGVETYTTFTFDNSTKVLTLPAVKYWYKGTAFTSTGAITCDLDLTADRDNSTNTLTANTLYYIYFKDATGKLYWSDTMFDFNNDIILCTIYWNGSAGAVQIEAHGYDRDIAWHKWAHLTIGTRYLSGLTLTAPTTANDGVIDIATGVIRDEDISFTTGRQQVMRGWRLSSATKYTWADYSIPYLGTLGAPAFNNASYALETFAANRYACFWVYASLDKDRPIYVIPSQISAAYTTIANARAEAPPTLANLPFNAEFKLIYRFIYSGDGQFQESADYRLSQPLPSGGIGTVTAGAVSFSPTGGISATSVQAALEELDTEKENIADIKAIQPAVAFLKRVTADGGTVVDKSLLAKVYTEFNQALTNTHCLYFPQIGIKERTSGINKYCNKPYDLGSANNDGVMATEATQSYVGGYIAPNEFRCLKYLQGQTQTGEITIPTKSYLATDSWTLFLVLKANKRGTTRILTGANSYIDITATTIVLHNGTSATLTGTHTYDVGKIAQIEFQYSNGTGLIKVNNVPLATTVISTTMSFTRLAYSSTNPFDGSIYYFHLENVRISEADSQKRYNFLRSLFAEIEGIGIGNQFWQTSNVEQTVAGNGTVIPEVQGVSTAVNPELITNAADRDFSSDTGYWTKGVGVTIEGGVCSANVSGNNQRIIRRANILTLSKPYIATFEIVSISQGSVRLIDDWGAYGGAITTTGIKSVLISTAIYGSFPAAFEIQGTNAIVQIDNLSIKEAGWADLTTPARCYYDNSITNGAVYNKLFNGYAVALLKNYSPSGYRVATYADWLQLSTFAGGNTISGKKIKKDGLLYWLTTNSGTNELGLSVIGLGKRNVDGTFANIGTEANFWTADSYLVTIANNADTISFASGADLKTGAGVLLIRTSPTVPQRGVIRVSTTANIASTPVSIPIPFGCQVESIRIRNKQAATNLTSISATHNNTAGASLGTLITGKTVNAATSSIFVATQLDMASQETDGTVRILATGNGNEGCDIEVTYKVMAL